jgi:hypothetical protein
MSDLGNTLNQAVNEYKESPAGQRLKEDARDFQDRLRTGEVDKRIREDLLSVLQRFNAELEKVARPRESKEESQDKTEVNMPGKWITNETRRVPGAKR